MLRTIETDRGGRALTITLSRDQVEVLGNAAGELAEMLDQVLTGLARLRDGLPGRPVDDLVRYADALMARMDGVRAAAIAEHARQGGSYGELALALGVPRATAQTRRRAVLGAEQAPAELWARGARGEEAHPGAKVPASMRDWSIPWPAYCPVDITPPELLPAGLPASVREGWAEPWETPQDVPDWLERSREALVPYDCDDRRYPLNPTGRTGRTGRNLGKWGENQAGDPIVIAGTGADQRILLIRRSDVGQWAIPGGMVDPGETAPATLVRELREETGVDLAEYAPEIVSRGYVEDWRNTDHAWVASTAALFRLPDVVPATAGDDAADARWWPLTDLDTLTTDLAPHGGLYEAHRPLLAAALKHL